MLPSHILISIPLSYIEIKTILYIVLDLLKVGDQFVDLKDGVIVDEECHYWCLLASETLFLWYVEPLNKGLIQARPLLALYAFLIELLAQYLFASVDDLCQNQILSKLPFLHAELNEVSTYF